MTYKSKDNHLRIKKSINLGDELDSYVGRIDSPIAEKGYKSYKLQNAWEHVAPREVREHTDTVLFDKHEKEPIILIYVDDSSWAAELNMQKEFYRIKMEDELAQPITEVKFRVSRITALRKK